MLYLALIPVLMIGVSVETCPDMCECRSYPRDDLPKTSLYYTSVSCEAYQNSTVMDLDNTTKQFRISNADGQGVLGILQCLLDRKSALPFLDVLTISRSELTNASARGLDWIRSLTLTDNRLSVLPQLLLNLTALQTLDLSQNHLAYIGDHSFRTLRSLESLNLSANALNNISDSGFLGLDNLKRLDLSRNNLTSLSDRTFVIQSLQHLNLSRNHLEVLEPCFSRLTGLQQLDVSWNRLSRVAPGSLELPSLTRLLLAGNEHLGTSPDAAVLVGTGRKLQTVDASRTGLKQVPAALTHSIRSLRLADNDIRFVNCGDLDSYPLLQLLDLTSNKLATVEEDALGRLDSLVVLYLAGNGISVIPRSLPENLKALHVERNAVGRVAERDFQGLTELEVLLLSDNNISVIEQGAFGQLKSLITLDLSRNPVLVLSPGSLTGPFALQVLRLSSMRIISPAEENTFPLSTPDNLITLDLSDSPGLARQLLADTATLVASKQLQELDLSGTSLEYIRSDLLHFLPQLRALHIGHNRLNCTKLHWLGSWLRRQDTGEYRDVVCSSPPDFWGVPLMDLQDDETSTVDSEPRQREPTAETLITTPPPLDDEYHSLPSWRRSRDQTAFGKIARIAVKKSISADRGVPMDLQDDETSTVELEPRQREPTAKTLTQRMVTIPSSLDNEYHSLPSWRRSRDQTAFGKTAKTAVKKFVSANRHSNENESFKNNLPTTSVSTSLDAHQAPTATFQTNGSSGAGTVTIGALSETTMAENADETASTRPSPSGGFISEFSRDLLVASYEKTFNNSSEQSRSTAARPRWDGETSMYTNNKQDGGFLHPGMLILAAGAAAAAAALAAVAVRFAKNRRACREDDDVEVAISLPTVTDLW